MLGIAISRHARWREIAAHCPYKQDLAVTGKAFAGNAFLFSPAF
jgi:hypothetical protein